ncbi:MAG: glycosyltransferase [Homoserinimonas sp.]|jgi:N-acetylglucosaminyldiphosphoundecaprenol N-acetyl-beta-D-mannosaminyltransferase|nr:glycosyltransferase [Homoserinimonas sp.]
MTTNTRSVRGVLLGVPIDALSRAEILDLLMVWTEEPGTHVAVGINANVCNLAARNDAFTAHIRAADLAYADGQSVVWAANALGIRIPERVATTDLIYPLAESCAARGKTMFLFGSAPGVAERAGEELRNHNPALRIATSHGFLTSQNPSELLAQIHAHHTDVLLVGLGDPLQQAWIAQHRTTLDVPVIVSCGGLFDWTSGSQRRAPNWMISAGLEWLWRLWLEPTRLGKRYLVGNPIFVARFIRAFAQYLLSRPTRWR